MVDLGVTDPLRAVIIGFAGPALVLHLHERTDAAFRRAVRSEQEGFVVLTDGGRPRALRGRAAPGPDEDQLILHLTDRFELGQQRLYARAPIEVPALLHAGGHDSARGLPTRTLDLSCGGARVARPGGLRLRPGAPVRLELTVDDGEGSRWMNLAAHVQRLGEADLGLRFVNLEPSHCRSLMGAVLLDRRGRSVAAAEAEAAAAAVRELQLAALR